MEFKGAGARRAESTVLECRVTHSARRRFRLFIRCGSGKYADYVLVQHVQDFLRLLECDSVQQFKTNLDTPECRNGVMVGTD